jgi:lipopolysaccharide transport system permease protein
MASTVELVIRPRSGWQPIQWRDAVLHRELLGFLIWRDIKIRYRQTLLGGVWALLQPLLAMVLFTVLFHRLSGIKSDGPPYPLFVFAGTSVWTFFANAVSQASQSVVGNQQLVSKVYFPRIFIPLGAVGALLVDLFFSLGLLALLMLYYHWPVSIKLALLPAFILGAVLAASGAGLILSALNVSFRDVKYAVPFLIQMGLFVTPVIYPINYIPGNWKVLLGLNPMTGVVIGFRYALLGSEASWEIICISVAASLVMFTFGLFVFRRMEIQFSDVI